MKANLTRREPEMLERWTRIGLYERMLAERASAKAWVLHDGPPYANGRVHFGTALNKILKDFIVRSRAMLGFRTPFVPGWDCHGMPIEHNVARELGPRARKIARLELRALCRAHAEKYIDIQRDDFRRLGVIGDWGHPYLTFDPAYEAAEIGVLRRMVESGYIYRGLRPVHWCIDCRTALAEAEVEYHDHHSPSIYVAFSFRKPPLLPGDTAERSVARITELARRPPEGEHLANAYKEGRLFALIWTTTPWTLPANLAIALNETFDYVAAEFDNKWYVVAARRLEAIEQAIGKKAAGVIEIDREALHRLDGQDIFRHPFAERDSKLVYGAHVTADSGTGLVHTAPGHGYDDFVTGKQYGLAVLTPVDDAGNFTAEAGIYAGLNVFSANSRIVEDLRKAGALIHGEELAHSYPHCWRCKNPLIFRATEQWFLRVDHHQLRDTVLAEIDRVQWIPAWSRDRIRNMVATRPDWCLSRQRAWGVPIPAVRCTECGKVALELGVLERVEKIFAAEGSDAWYRRPVEDFVPADMRCPQCGGSAFTKEEDVLDVWFDSGVSHAAVLRQRSDLAWPADAYVEGIDQARGWFQAALICAVATEGQAPYRNVVSHGLALDELGRKMSKSLGNFEHAADVVNRMGADVFRLVFASVDYSADMSVGENLFSAVTEAYRKIRNTFRYLLGNLYDFDPATDLVKPEEMDHFDRYILARLERLKAGVRKAYESFDFQSAYHAIVKFVVVELSSLYVDVVRDRLYCSAARSAQRRSAQTALYRIADALVRMLAPLIPFTADEVHASIPGARSESVHLLELQPADPALANPEIEQRWSRALVVREEALKLLEAMRQSGEIGSSLEASILVVDLRGELTAEAFDHGTSLADLLIVSEAKFMEAPPQALQAEIAKGDGTYTQHLLKSGTSSPSEEVIWTVRESQDRSFLVFGRRIDGQKCPRCWKYFRDGGQSELDPRCRAVLQPA
jgi:isoleucyl-tRNA synthetase